MPTKKVILTSSAPKPIGPYSQAIQAGGFLFCSGQVAIDPQTGNVMSSESVEEQTRQVMRNIEAVLKTAGCSWGSVVKTTIFLQSMGDFGKVNEIYGTYFKEEPPARSTVEVSRLPKDVKVEIEVIALVS
ncbi:MAG: RidA family protein [Bdellovibrio sp.]|nr:RidA family protein [Bdellovibrio sp.]